MMARQLLAALRMHPMRSTDTQPAEEVLRGDCKEHRQWLCGLHVSCTLPRPLDAPPLPVQKLWCMTARNGNAQFAVGQGGGGGGALCRVGLCF